MTLELLPIRTDRLVLLLQKPVTFLQLAQLGRLSNHDTFLFPSFNAGLAHPLIQGPHTNPEILSDLKRSHIWFPVSGVPGWTFL